MGGQKFHQEATLQSVLYLPGCVLAAPFPFDQWDDIHAAGNFNSFPSGDVD
jgi:hypothetical protein